VKEIETMSQVLIHPATYENVSPALDKTFEVFPIELRGKKVLIKPNVLRLSEAKEGIVTHPSVLRALVEKVETMDPASIVVGDNPGLFNYGANEACFSKTGLMEAAKGHYQNIGIDAQQLAFNSEFMPFVSVSQAILDADIVISVPKFKTHGLTVLTGAIKNSYGILPGAQKARLHKAAGTPQRFHEMIVDVFKLRIPDLFIVDAVVGMQGNGPASPDLVDIGLVLASDNAVAVDAVIAMMMGCDPALLRFLQKAKEAGLGDYDLATIKVIGGLRQLPDFKLPPFSGEAILQNERVQALMQTRQQQRPHVNLDWCTGCGSCVEQCPASAMILCDNVPQVDADKCIACFCCQEICPEKAITLS
jgi:uncharacterized protein (DUF362 family)/Pyruvate/2-oxoacid:ferredoxin oxidoreductase delta subunit